MRLSISKREILIIVMLLMATRLAFPFLAEAIEIQENEIIDVSLDNEEWYGKIQIIKTVNDSKSDDPNLSGFEFSLYKSIDEEEKIVESKKTNAQGILEFDNLIEGMYRLYETKLDNYTGEFNEQGIELLITKDENPEGIFIVEVTNIKLYPNETMEETVNEEIEINIEDFDIEEFDIEDMDEWEIVIIDEPIPGAAPIIEKVESITSEEEIEIILTLPKTGELNPIPQSGIGAILILLGVYINKKKTN